VFRNLNNDRVVGIVLSHLGWIALKTQGVIGSSLTIWHRILRALFLIRGTHDLVK